MCRANLLAGALGINAGADAAADTFMLPDPATACRPVVTHGTAISSMWPRTLPATGEGARLRHAGGARQDAPSRVWVTRGTHTIWQHEVGNGMDRCMSGCRPATDRHGPPGAGLRLRFVGGYVSAVGLAAYQWQPGRTFRNLLDAVSEDGFLRYPASNRRRRRHPALPGQQRRARPLLIHTDAGPFTAGAHYQARCYRWNGRDFHLTATAAPSALCICR